MTPRQRQPLSRKIGGRIRELREARGLSQDAFATLARRAGLTWSSSQLAKAERGERDVSLGEFLLLAVAFEVRLADLLPQLEGDVAVHGVAAIDAGSIRTLLLGGMAAGRAEDGSARAEVADALAEVRRAREDLASAGADVVMKLAKQLHASPIDVAALARELYGCSLPEERDARLAGRRADGDKRALRGHITREIRAEISEAWARRELDMHDAARAQLGEELRP